MDFSGYPFCENTPYKDYEARWDDSSNSPEDFQALALLAQAEVRFLRSLLPAQP
jgi:hypothetical protein